MPASISGKATGGVPVLKGGGPSFVTFQRSFVSSEHAAVPRVYDESKKVVPAMSWTRTRPPAGVSTGTANTGTEAWSDRRLASASPLSDGPAQCSQKRTRRAEGVVAVAAMADVVVVGSV